MTTYVCRILIYSELIVTGFWSCRSYLIFVNTLYLAIPGRAIVKLSVSCKISTKADRSVLVHENAVLIQIMPDYFFAYRDISYTLECLLLYHESVQKQY